MVRWVEVRNDAWNGWLGKARRVSWVRDRDEGLRDH
jgi:hypothetical protein